MAERHEAKSKLTGVEHRIYSQWNDSSEVEALSLIDIMKNNPSMRWRDMLIKAEAHDIAHWQLLLQNADSIYESIAEAIAGSDGLVAVKNAENEKG